MTQQGSDYNAHKIEEGIWAIEDGFVRSFLVTGEDKALLIDTGFSGGDLMAVVKRITSLPVLVALTHSDHDHTGALGQFWTAYMHPSEYENYIAGAQGAKKADFLPVWEGDVFNLGGTLIEAVLIPGHTPGSIALFDRQRNIIFTGDSVSVVPVFLFGKGRNIDAYIYSIEKLMRMTDDKARFFASHGQVELGRDMLPLIIAGAKDVAAGKIKGTKPDMDVPCLLYDCGKAKFLY